MPSSKIAVAGSLKIAKSVFLMTCQYLCKVNGFKLGPSKTLRFLARIKTMSILEINMFYFVLACCVFFESQAFAYLDPGLTSYSLQIIAATLVGVIFFAKKYVRRLVSFFTRKVDDKDGGK